MSIGEEFIKRVREEWKDAPPDDELLHWFWVHTGKRYALDDLLYDVWSGRKPCIGGKVLERACEGLGGIEIEFDPSWYTEELVRRLGLLECDMTDGFFSMLGAFIFARLLRGEYLDYLPEGARGISPTILDMVDNTTVECLIMLYVKKSGIPVDDLVFAISDIVRGVS